MHHGATQEKVEAKSLSLVRSLHQVVIASMLPRKTASEERHPDINPNLTWVYSWDWVRDEGGSLGILTGKGRSGPPVSPILLVL